MNDVVVFMKPFTNDVVVFMTKTSDWIQQPLEDLIHSNKFVIGTMTSTFPPIDLHINFECLQFGEIERTWF